MNATATSGNCFSDLCVSCTAPSSDDLLASEDAPEYWPTIYKLVALGRFTEGADMLRRHPLFATGHSPIGAAEVGKIVSLDLLDFSCELAFVYWRRHSPRSFLILNRFSFM